MKFYFNFWNFKINVGYFKIKVEIFVNKVGSFNINLGKFNIKDWSFVRFFLLRCYLYVFVSEYSCFFMKKKIEIGNDIYLVKLVEFGYCWIIFK